MTLYSYTITIDTGFAPNPFHGFCTLACCKPQIRKKAREGDYVVGIGSVKLGQGVIYAMQVEETLDFDDYWRDPRFQVKRPDVNAGGVEAVGDNIYHRDNTGGWQQETSQHVAKDKDGDLSGQKVLIGRNFIYWGEQGPPLPDSLKGIIPGRGHRSDKNESFIPDFIEWFESYAERGCIGEPTDDISSESGEYLGAKGLSRPGKTCG